MSKRHFTTYCLDGFLAALNDPPIMREAKTLAAKLSRIDVLVRESDLTAGYLTSEPFDLFFGPGYVCRDPYSIENSEDKADRRALAEFKRKVAIVMPHIAKSDQLADFTEHECQASEAGLVNSIGWAGHIAFDHRRLLKLGIPGIAAEIDHWSRNHEGTADNQTFYTAMRVTLEAVRTYIHRHGEEAAKMAREASGEQRERLARISENCRWLCDEPPKTFAQALQLLWLVHIIDGMDSFGRFDYALEDFYASDISSGAMTREEAADLLENIWPRINGIQNMTIGGQDSEGRDCSSDFTLLCIEVTQKIGRAEPNLCLRMHSGTPDHIWEAAVRCIGDGMGTPALYNDDVIVPSLLDWGIAKEDALNYCLCGCSQIVIPGCSHFGCDDGVFNVAKCLELALHGGVDPITGYRIGPATGAPESFDTYEKFQGAFHAQVAAAAELGRIILEKVDTVLARQWGFPLRTLLTKDCLARAESIRRGGARYNAIQTECVGITNVADSLVALKKFVFEDKNLSLSEMVSLLDKDWQGAEDMRLMCLNKPPKFGNDDPQADETAAWVSKIVWEEIRRHKCARGNGPIIPGEVVFNYHISYGQRTGATPEGRRRGTPLADSCGPSQGRDLQGPTAVMKSVSKLPLGLATTCAVLNMKFPKRSFADDETRTKILQLIKTYFEIGGMQLQVTVVDREQLLDAQTNPDQYRGLVVRVGGYSAYFTDLSKEMQDEIISRTEVQV